MKSKIALLLLVQLLAWLTSPSAHAQGTAFTYQGRLTDTNGAANGSYDFTFAVFDTGSGGMAGSGTITNVAVAVSNGLFTTTLDFGNGPEGAPAWLEITVRTNSGSGGGAFTTLAPRQQVTPTPYAMFATTASNLVGHVALAQLPAEVVTNGAGGVNLTGAFTGNGADVTNVNAATLGGLSAGTFWQLGGNSVGADQFLGSTNNQPLEFKVNGLRALRIEDNGDSSDPDSTPDGAPNMIGGSRVNYVGAGVVGATIAGGGATNVFGSALTNSVLANFGVVSGGSRNTIQADATAAAIGGGDENTIGTDALSATISGGSLNTIQSNAWAATIGGGAANSIQTYASYATGGGGYQNTIQTYATYATIGGGRGNTIQTNAARATIGGGNQNTIQINANYATIPGGHLNTAASYAFAAGRRAKAISTGAFVWADSQDADFSSTATNQFCIRASGGVQLDTNTSLSFGSQTRQMLNLWSTNYGAGVQALTTYFRSSDGFSWFSGGAHSDTLNDPGPGGSVRMRLDSGGLAVNGTFVSLSDRHAKENFAAVSAQEILAKVAALPITRWNFKQETGTPHIGPMAQDFHAAFGTGLDDRHIATVDADGVALAAIQGLNQKLEEQTAAARRKDAEITDLKTRLEKLEQLMNLKAGAAR